MKKHITILIFPIMIFIFFAGCFFYIIFTINTNSQKIIELENEKIARELAKENITDLEKTINEIKDELASTEQIWLGEEDIPEFLNFIEKLGEITGTKVSILNITDSPSSGTGLLLLLSIEGTFEDVFRTLRLLENIPYATDFSRISVQRKEETGIWTADLDFTILSFRK